MLHNNIVKQEKGKVPGFVVEGKDSSLTFRVESLLSGKTHVNTEHSFEIFRGQSQAKPAVLAFNYKNIVKQCFNCN